MSTYTPSTARCTTASPSRQHPLLIAVAAMLLICTLLVCASNTQADSRRERPGQRPVREAIGEVEQNYRGHVVDVQSLRRDSNEDVYRMRVLQRDGRVKTVTVPANEQEQRQQQQRQRR